jgi:hypothetical protein
MDGLTLISYRICTAPVSACRQTDNGRESETKSNEEPARSPQVAIFARFGVGLREINRSMDQSRGATQIVRFANLKRRLYSGEAAPATNRQTN